MVGISWSPCLVISCMMTETQNISKKDQLVITGGLFLSVYVICDGKTNIRSGKEPLQTPTGPGCMSKNHRHVHHFCTRSPALHGHNNISTHKICFHASANRSLTNFVHAQLTDRNAQQLDFSGLHERRFSCAHDYRHPSSK